MSSSLLSRSTQGRLLGTRPVPSPAPAVAVVENKADKGKGPCRREAGRVTGRRLLSGQWDQRAPPVLREARVQQWGWTDGLSWGHIHMLARTPDRGLAALQQLQISPGAAGAYGGSRPGTEDRPRRSLCFQAAKHQVKCPSSDRTVVQRQPLGRRAHPGGRVQTTELQSPPYERSKAATSPSLSSPSTPRGGRVLSGWGPTQHTQGRLQDAGTDSPRNPMHWWHRAAVSYKRVRARSAVTCQRPRVGGRRSLAQPATDCVGHRPADWPRKSRAATPLARLTNGETVDKMSLVNSRSQSPGLSAPIGQSPGLSALIGGCH